MTKNIFFDFDGTLIDCKRRLYELFQELVPQSKFSLDEYWEIKRKRINQKKLLSDWFAYSEEKILEFHKTWLEKVEEDQRLELDSSTEGALDLLDLGWNLYGWGH